MSEMAETCPTGQCPGDVRYAAPGRRHLPGCAYPNNLVPNEAAPATIRPVPRPRGELPDTAIRVLVRERERLEREQQKYRTLVVSALEQGSFAEVSKATGLSTNTLQRWKREAAS